MILQGYKAQVKAQSSEVALTDEATTGVGDLVYTITDTSKRILDYYTAVIVKVDGSTATTGFVVNRLNGTVTFDTAVVRTVTVSGAYVLLTETVACNTLTCNFATAMIDVTAYNADGYSEFVVGIKSGTADLGRVSYDDDYFLDMLFNDTVKIIEYYTDRSTEPIRFYGIMTSDTINAAISGSIPETLTFQITEEFIL